MKILPALCLALASTVALADEPSAPTAAQLDSEREQKRLLLEEGRTLLMAKRPAQAIEVFDAIISYYEGVAAGSPRLYSSRSQAETLAYLLMAAEAKVNATALNSHLGYAYFLKSFALTELKQTVAAERAIKKALEVSPHNALFLAERGNQLATARAWDDALATFRSAEVAARSFTPEPIKTEELGRALRGQGYVLVELNRWPEALKIYEACLALNPDDRIAAAELAFVRDRWAKTGK